MIPARGFDDRLNTTGLFGRNAVYLAEMASKSDEYCEPDDEGVCTLFIAMAVMGVPYFIYK